MWEIILFVVLSYDKFVWYLLLWLYEEWKGEILVWLWFILLFRKTRVDWWLFLLIYWKISWLLDFYWLEGLNDIWLNVYLVYLGIVKSYIKVWEYVLLICLWMYVG